MATINGAYKCFAESRCFVRIPTLLIATPTHVVLTASNMSGFVGHSTRTSPLSGRKPGVVGSSNERRTRRHARDFSITSITCAGDVSSSSSSILQAPDIEKDLPRIPSSTRSLPPVPVSQNLRRTPTTEAQIIAAQYRRRRGSLEALRSEVWCPPELEVSSFLILHTRFPPRILWIASASCGS